MSNIHNERMLSRGQVAKILGVCPDTILNWEDSGKITSFRASETSHRRYRQSDIEAILATRKGGSGTPLIKMKIADIGVGGKKNPTLDLSDVAKSNYDAHKKEKDYALAVINARYKSFMEEVKTADSPEELKVIVARQNSKDLNYWSLMLTRATEGIARATGLEYFIDVNTAAKRIEKEGYAIVDPTDSSGRNLLEGSVESDEEECDESQTA